MFTPIEAGQWSWPSIASIVALGLGPTAAGSLILILLIRRVGASFMSLANYVTPLFAVIAGAVLFGERLGVNVFLALALIFAGVAISQRRGKSAPVLAAAALQKSS
jgi:drug/metabolite transporter (DMT)-like permease